MAMASIMPLLCYLLIFLYFNTTVPAAAEANKSEIDRQSLLCFKYSIDSDPLGILNSWSNEPPARVVSLNLTSALLGGQIPSCVANLTSLSQMRLADNSLSGAIPDELGKLPGLQTLMLAGNHPEGLDLSHNNLKGEIPEDIGLLERIVLVNLSNNMFAGGFPSAFLNLLCIQYIDLSRNDLSGIVPQLGNLIMLEELDLSYNNFEGEIPTSGIFLNSTVVHLDGNKRLCSNLSILALPPCGGSAKTKNHVPFLPVLVPVVTVVFLLLLLVLFTLWKEMEVHSPSLHRRWNLFYSVTHWIKQVCVFPQLHMVRNILCFLTLGRREIGIYPSYQEALKKVSYSDIAKATKWFSPVHRVSSTRTGSVYVGRFKFDSDLVAIKVFNLHERGVHGTYFTECEVLRSIRHRNILKCVTLCSTLDTENNEFKALVFQFMPNGSLERWLHPKQQTDKPKRALSLGQRICIVTDVASALDYLHNQLIPPLVHCDLKPGNVLLDYDMTARVGDFGSAKFLSQDCGGLKRLVSVQGTVGYLAPEYGMGCGITRQGDVYSFGVLLLEMLTGRRPTDEMFVDGLNLHNFTSSMFPDRIAEILDPHMAHDEEHRLYSEIWMQSHIIPLVALGLPCSMESPKDRPGMQHVCAKLCAIKEAFL